MVAFIRIKSIDLDKMVVVLHFLSIWLRWQYWTQTFLQLNSELWLVLDKHAPVQSKLLTVWLNTPWFTETIKREKL